MQPALRSACRGMSLWFSCWWFSNRWLACLLALACGASLPASLPAVEVHGPIAIWHGDPTTEVTVEWVERISDSMTEQWFEAQAGFGYGDGDDATSLDMSGRHRALFIRKAFTIQDPEKLDALELKVLYDDGFIAWINGTEVVRQKVKGPADEVESVGSHEAKEFESFPIEDLRDLLKKGENVLAVAGYNTRVSSSDFSLHPELSAQQEDETVPLVPRDAHWQVWLGDHPADDWTTKVEPIQEKPEPVLPTWTVRYREQGEDDWQERPAQHRPFAITNNRIGGITLTELSPDTTYDIEIRGKLEGETVLERSFALQTAPEKLPSELRFVTGGDMYHSRDRLDAMNRRAGQQRPLFALLGGDLAYANGRNADRWYDWLDSWYENAVTPEGRQVPMIAVIGNHETSGSKRENAPFYYSLFPLPDDRSNFVVDFGKYMSIVNLDSDHTQRVADQTEWLEATLQARETRPLLFACYHRPTYGTLVKGDSTSVRTQWVPLFEKYQVDAVFENDHHVYKRSLPIYEGEVDEERGIPYLGDGAWGVGTRKIPEKGGTNLPYIARAESLNHLIQVTLRDGKLHYEAILADGEVFDTYERAPKTRGQQDR